MFDRRKAQRFTLSCPVPAHLHVVNEVIIERTDAETVTVLAEGASLAGEEFVLQLRGAEGRFVNVPVRTVRSQPTFMSGQAPAFRIDLRVTAPAHGGE
jgi:hypothetical protein